MAPLPVNTPLADYQARLAEPSDIHDELPFLLQAASGYRECRVLELGVRTGRSTSAFLAAAAAMNGHVWSADCNTPEVPSYWAESRRWTFWLGDDMDLCPETAGWPASYDVVFIDTSHRYDHTLAELRKFVRYVAPGGMVLCHDTRLPGGYVAKALDDFCAEYPRLAITLPWRPGLMHVPDPVGWVEAGGWRGLGVISEPNGPAA